MIFQRLGSKSRRRRLRLKKDMRKQSARGSIAGGNAVTCDFWPWGGAAGAKREQSSPEEWERISGGAAQESTASKDSVGEIEMTLVFGCALRRVHSPDSGLEKTYWRTRSGFFA